MVALLEAVTPSVEIVPLPPPRPERPERPARAADPRLQEEEADDAAADALRVAIERRLEFDPARAANVRTWLYGIAVIKAADHLRKRGSVVPLDPETEPLWAAEARAHKPTNDT